MESENGSHLETKWAVCADSRLKLILFAGNLFFCIQNNCSGLRWPWFILFPEV
jgi:hypothetical protein